MLIFSGKFSGTRIAPAGCDAGQNISLGCDGDPTGATKEKGAKKWQSPIISGTPQSIKLTAVLV
jgi:hypothetical protein